MYQMFVLPQHVYVEVRHLSLGKVSMRIMISKPADYYNPDPGKKKSKSHQTFRYYYQFAVKLGKGNMRNDVMRPMLVRVL